MRARTEIVWLVAVWSVAAILAFLVLTVGVRDGPSGPGRKDVGRTRTDGPPTSPRWAPPKDVPAGAFTLGKLIEELSRLDAACEESMRGAGNDARLRLQVGVLCTFQPDPKRHPGIEGIQRLCRERYGKRFIRTETVLDLRSDLCVKRRLTVAEANALPLPQVALALED